MRSYIAQELETVATDLTGRTYQQTTILNAKKLLAFCFTIGFGVPKDDNIAAKWLDALPSGEEENCTVISRLKSAAPLYHRDPRQADLWDWGHLHVLDFADYYQERGLSSRAEETYKREIQNLEEVWGEPHWLPQALRHRLGLILLGKEHWKEAGNSLRSLLLQQEKLLGSEDSRTIATTLALARTYREPESWWNAESIYSDLILKGEKIWSMEHPRLIELATQQVSLWKQLAIAHEKQEPGNPAIRRLLPQILEKAESFETLMLTMTKHIWGEDHPTTLLNMNNLVQTYTLRGRYEDAEALGLEVLYKCKETLPALDICTCWATVQLADVKIRQGHLTYAELLITELLVTMNEVIASENWGTRMSMVKLAMIYRDPGRLAKAERLILRVIQTELKMEDFDKDTMPERMEILMKLMRAQSHEEDALRVEEYITEMRDATYERNDADRLVEEELWNLQR